MSIVTHDEHLLNDSFLSFYLVQQPPPFQMMNSDIEQSQVKQNTSIEYPPNHHHSTGDQHYPTEQENSYEQNNAATSSSTCIIS